MTTERTVTHVHRCDYPGMSLVIVTIGNETRNFEFPNRYAAADFAAKVIESAKVA